VSLTWKLEDTQGNLIDELKEPVEFFYGGDDLLEKVEETLAEQEIGFADPPAPRARARLRRLRPRPRLLRERSIFPEGVEPGMQFDGMPEGATTEACRPTRSTP
jgi:FKBP-type peptidyl-prolyl cis-trans isomerase SlyD